MGKNFLESRDWILHNLFQAVCCLLFFAYDMLLFSALRQCRETRLELGMIICQIEAHIWTLISRGILAVGLSLFTSSSPEDKCINYVHCIHNL